MDIIESASSQAPEPPPVEKNKWWSRITNLAIQVANLARNIRSMDEPKPILCNRLNPLIYRNALTILNLSLEDVENPSLITDAHARIIAMLTKRKERVPKLLANELGSID
ncbi:MAG: hypothetical protein LVR00_09860 [Rhabdochlamydiaceae bacterium]|jgi:hypothetical protein